MSARTASGARAELEPIDARTWRLCWVIVLGAFASGLDAAIVNVGLDTMSRSLGAPLSLTQWVASGYLLALAVSLPAAGWLSRRLGSGRLWLLALAAFTIASLGCALAPSVELLIVARVLQGLSGGILIPTGQTVLGQTVGPARLGRAMGTLGIAVSAAPAIGSLLGGVILRYAPWPWLFVINLPIGATGLLLGRRLIPRGESSNTQPLHRTCLVLIAVGLPALVYATTRWGDTGHLDAGVLGVAALAILALAGFVLVSLRSAQPLFDVGLYRLGAFRAGAITAFFSGVLIFGSGVLFALYFQLGRGQSPFQAGISLIGVAAATSITAPLTGRWVDRSGPAPVALVGALLALATTLPLIWLPVTAPLWLVQVLLVGFGAAVNLVAMPAGIAAYQAVPANRLPDAITQVNILQRVGGSLGGAICAVLIARTPADPAAAFSQAAMALVVSAVGCTIGALLIRSSRAGDHPA